MQNVDPTVNYISQRGEIRRSFRDSLLNLGGNLVPDYAALYSLFSFQYLPFDHTVDQRIRRVYFSKVENTFLDAEKYLQSFPRSRCSLLASHRLSKTLVDVLLAELECCLSLAERVTILLSGGLDSRLIYAAVDHLRRSNRITSEVRAITWGQPNSADWKIAKRITSHDCIPWYPLVLSTKNLLANIKETSTVLGPLISPVHLHAMPQVIQLDFLPSEIILAGTLGNALIRGEYLYHHVSYGRLPTPRDWLGVLSSDCQKKGRESLRDLLSNYRRLLLKDRPRLDAYELELLISYNQNMLLYAFDYIRRKGLRLHQAFSTAHFFNHILNAIPFQRSRRLSLQCIKILRPDLAILPTNLHAGLSSSSCPLRSSSPWFHDYGKWTRENLDDVLHMCTTGKIVDMGLINLEGLYRAAGNVLNNGNTVNETSYIILLIACLSHFIGNVNGNDPKQDSKCNSVAHMSDYVNSSRLVPPWGFASRPYDSFWERLPYRLIQPFRALGFRR